MAKAKTSSSKKNDTAEAIARAVGAGSPAAVETVNFGKPDRPKTCIEIDFPILPVNQVATIEGNSGKPIYQMSKWWARRRSSVFRSILLGASMKAPDDPALAAKTLWNAYYRNHQQKGALAEIRVADIFMGGGTTLVEASRLGMRSWGVDLSPVAWFVVKTEFAEVAVEDVCGLLASIEATVKPTIMPFFACDCPRGHRGIWTRKADGVAMGAEFEPLRLTPSERLEYEYRGPEMIYAFWAKHGPCQVSGCHHRTPIMSSPVMATKTLTVKAWPNQSCPSCHKTFDIEQSDARMAPGVALVVSGSEGAFAVLDQKGAAACPHCRHVHHWALNPKQGENKKVELSLLVHPSFLAGSKGIAADGSILGGSATDQPEATAAWLRERASCSRLLEVRGALPDTVTCPETNVTFSTAKGTVPKKSHFTCQGRTCGREWDILEAVKLSGKTGPTAAYAIQGYCPTCNEEKRPYKGRFFAPVKDPEGFVAAAHEWSARKDADLAAYWPRSEVPFGFMTSMNNGGIPNHGYTHWWTMFNERELLVLSLLLRAIVVEGGPRHAWSVREFVLGAFQQYLRNENMFCIWDQDYDKLAPHMSNNNYHPKANMVENCVFSPLGRGNWRSCTESLIETASWVKEPWELVSTERLSSEVPELAKTIATKSVKVNPGDPVRPTEIACTSATDLKTVAGGAFDLVVTDPPFGGLLHYSELADFFYVWLRLVLKDRYPDYFGPEYTPKALEVVANRARQPEDADGFYQRLLTQCWREAHRILKPGGILAFTFHHSEDEPWVAVLESLFEAGFYLEATYPIRSDETKGEGAKPGTFGSQKIEYDIVHVCRKRMEEPKAVSWARMRREVQEDVRRLQSLLEHHAKEGLAAADLQVIKRGKALEYFSRHYGKVFVDEERTLTVKDAVVGIIQLLDEEAGKAEPPPVDAEPFTRQFLRIFNGNAEQPRDQVQKFLRGTGVAPEEFEARGWCTEEKKMYRVVSPLDLARAWIGKHRKNLVGDYDQAMFLIGACFDGSGINVAETLRNQNFKPCDALGALLDWHARRGHSAAVRAAAARARVLFESRQWSQEDQTKQLSLPGVPADATRT